MTALPRNTILIGDARERLSRLPSACVDCIVTSPPYFAVRDYGHERHLGHEADVDVWVDGLRAVFREAGRVLKPTGSLWLNLGDGYARHPSEGGHAEEPATWAGATGARPAGRRLDTAEQGHLGQNQPDADLRPRPADLYLRGRLLLLHALAALLLQPRCHPRAPADDPAADHDRPAAQLSAARRRRTEAR